MLIRRRLSEEPGLAPSEVWITSTTQGICAVHSLVSNAARGQPITIKCIHEELLSDIHPIMPMLPKSNGMLAKDSVRVWNPVKQHQWSKAEEAHTKASVDMVDKQAKAQVNGAPIDSTKHMTIWNTRGPQSNINPHQVACTCRIFRNRSARLRTLQENIWEMHHWIWSRVRFRGNNLNNTNLKHHTKHSMRLTRPNSRPSISEFIRRSLTSCQRLNSMPAKIF